MEPENLAHQVFGLARARGARKPGTFAPSLLAPQQRQGHMWRNRPQSKTPFSRKEFITQNLALIFQFLPAPSSSLHPTERPNVPGFWARPGPRSPKTWHICSFLPCTTATARPHKPELEEPRDRPRSQSKTPFSRKEFIIQNLALIFQFLPAPSFPYTQRTERPNVPGFWARPGPWSPKTWHICSFPPCTTATARPHVAESTPIRNALFTKRIYHSKSDIGPNQKRLFYEKNLSLKIWPWFFNFCPLPSPPYTQ